jgi:hypothetical protein
MGVVESQFGVGISLSQISAHLATHIKPYEPGEMSFVSLIQAVIQALHDSTALGT